ncbi:uncharacterized protein [Nicotiana tomentosiformis]|uniref:uncharacterized protein n=1 Tax=Nicotiana tomentosiformis TaxID=4098 RepID=UPI00388C64E2
MGPVMSDEEQKRLERIGRLQPPSFSGDESKNAQDFLDRYQRIIRTAGILETSGVSFTTFQLMGAAFKWWETYERSKQISDAPLLWHEFSVLFLETFVPQTRREELHRQFELLCQKGICVTQYEMRFSELAFHVGWLVPTDRENIRKFIDGLNYQLCFVMTLKNVAGANFDKVANIARWLELVCSQEHEEREVKRPHVLGGSNGVPSGEQPYHSRGCHFTPSQMAHPVHHGTLSRHGSYSARLVLRA